jgi:flagellar protein FliL
MGQGNAGNVSGSFMSLAIAMLLVCVAGFGFGIGARVLHGSGKTEDSNAKVAEGHEGAAKKGEANGDGHSKGAKDSNGDEAEEHSGPDIAAADNMAEMVVEPLTPVITNVANPKSVWIRLEGSIIVKSGSEVSPKVLSAQAGQQVMAYLRSIDLKQVEGSSGLFHVKEDLNEIMQSFSGGEVRQILISGFIVE